MQPEVLIADDTKRRLDARMSDRCCGSPRRPTGLPGGIRLALPRLTSERSSGRECCACC